MTLQRRVQDVVDELVATGAETGPQVAVHHRAIGSSTRSPALPTARPDGR